MQNMQNNLKTDIRPFDRIYEAIKALFLSSRCLLLENQHDRVTRYMLSPNEKEPKTRSKRTIDIIER